MLQMHRMRHRAIVVVGADLDRGGEEVALKCLTRQHLFERAVAMHERLASGALWAKNEAAGLQACRARGSRESFSAK